MYYNSCSHLWITYEFQSEPESEWCISWYWLVLITPSCISCVAVFRVSLLNVGWCWMSLFRLFLVVLGKFSSHCAAIAKSFPKSLRRAKEITVGGKYSCLCLFRLGYIKKFITPFYFNWSQDMKRRHEDKIKETKGNWEIKETTITRTKHTAGQE